MKKKNKKKGKKTLTAVGAVIAAGLSPGILSATPGMLPPCPSMEFTAADMVSINGEVIDFDELFVTPQVNNDDDDEVMRAQREKAIRDSIRRVQKENAKVYGPPPPRRDEQMAREKAIRDSIRRVQESRALVYGPPPPRPDEQRDREKAIRDSIRRAQEKMVVVYGPPPPRPEEIKAREEAERKYREELAKKEQEEREAYLAAKKEEAIDSLQNELMDYCAGLIDAKAKDIAITPDSHLTRDMKMNSQQLEALTKEVEERYGLMMVNNELTQLTTLRRLARYIVEITAPHED